MPLTTDEQSIKSPSDFVELDKQNKVILLSNVYTVDTHYLQSQKTSVLHYQDDDACAFCKSGIKKRREYHYIARVNDEVGKLRLAAPVFYDMNQIEKMTGRDKRSYSWLVIKEGKGIETKYTTSKDEPVEVNPQAIEQNNNKLEGLMIGYEKFLTDKYNEFAPKYADHIKKVEEFEQSNPLAELEEGEEDVNQEAGRRKQEEVKDMDDLPF